MIFTSLAQMATASGLLMVSPVALPLQCQITTAPIINIRPNTKAIEYDVEKTSAELSQLKSNTISPYGLNVDQTTGGLRHDQPTMRTNLKFNVAQDPDSQTICMSYNTIDVDIQLQPKIYVAKEFNHGMCSLKVLEHEKKHVTVDRQVINKYTKLMGKAVQKAVNEAGVIGPYPQERLPDLQTMMTSHINNAITSVELMMTNEMNNLQQQVDSLDEYNRVNKYCTKSTQRALESRQKEFNKR